MAYESVQLQDVISIHEIISIHYFEYMSNFFFEGESHNFWEFLCVDKGEVNVVAGHLEHTLTRGEIIFHKPNEFHNVKANGMIAPNLVVIAFHCSSPLMKFFENKILSISEKERNLIAQIIIEARNAFSSRLDDPYLQKLERKYTAIPGSEQLIRIYLEELMISLLLRFSNAGSAGHKLPEKSVKQKSDSQLFVKIQSYLEENLNEHLSIQQICHDNLIGRSQLQKIFREKCQCGIIEYFSRMKIESAKQLIRDNHMNFTQISDSLGYTSIHYFSRQFKQLTGMTPSEYASSIMVISEPALKDREDGHESAQ